MNDFRISKHGDDISVQGSMLNVTGALPGNPVTECNSNKIISKIASELKQLSRDCPSSTDQEQIIIVGKLIQLMEHYTEEEKKEVINTFKKDKDFIELMNAVKNVNFNSGILKIYIRDWLDSFE